MSERITVIRTPHTSKRPYFSMRRETAQDARLTWEARGVLAYLLSKPDDWKVMIADLKQNCGRDKVRKILAELKQYGYLTIGQGRDSKGKFTGEYQVYEHPVTENQSPDTSNRIPVTGSPVTENHPLHNTDIQSTETSISPAGDSKPKSKRKPEPFYDAIAEVWKSDASGYIGQLRSMFQGVAKSGEWKRCNFDPPVIDPHEILAFGEYMRKRMAEKKLTEPPTACVTIQRWFYDFRMAKVKPVTSVLDGLRLVS